jgi:hypothetical protein
MYETRYEITREFIRTSLRGQQEPKVRMGHQICEGRMSIETWWHGGDQLTEKLLRESVWKAKF